MSKLELTTMTVAKLIAELQTLPQTAKVVVEPSIAHDKRYQGIGLITNQRKSWGDGQPYVVLVTE